MIYALAASFGLAALFLFLFVRSAIANGKLRNQIAETKKSVDIKDRQMEIAARPKETPDELLKRMENGTL